MPTSSQQQHYRAALDFAIAQVLGVVERHPDYFPMYTTRGQWRREADLWTDWTGGFLTGQLWNLYNYSGNESLRKHAEHYSRLLEHRQNDRTVHDLGFIFLNSYLPWHRDDDNERLHEVVLTAGRTLAQRFQERGQYLCSFVGRDSLFIDIMMNVPIIFYTGLQTGDDELLRIAHAHCRTTAATIVRDDGSTAHEGIFDLETGEFLRETTHQGLRPDSRWARGLAWSLYGFSQVYALTRDPFYYEVATRNARFWIDGLPDDGVPWWDFDADVSQPPPWGAQKDSSAAAIAASGLLHLAAQGENAEQAAEFRACAERMLDALLSPEYLARETPGWEGILKHGVYHTAKNLGVGESVAWGEHFFVEALYRSVKL